MYSDQAGAPVGEGLILRSSQGKLELRIGAKGSDGHDQEIIIVSNPPMDGEGLSNTGDWIFVAITWDGRSVLYFVGTDRVPIRFWGGGHFKGAVKPPSNMLSIGNSSSFSRGVDGYIDNFRFYDEALTPGQLEALREQDAK
jgi:hypothetical protein